MRVQEHIRATLRSTGSWPTCGHCYLPLLPRYRSEGKSYLTIAFGCTGGKHRSVFLAELMARWLLDSGWEATTVHRDLDRDAAGAVRRQS